MSMTIPMVQIIQKNPILKNGKLDKTGRIYVQIIQKNPILKNDNRNSFIRYCSNNTKKSNP